MESFSSVRIVLRANDEVCKATASVKVADLVYLTNLRVIQGKHHLFVSMACKKTPNGEYQDIYFPANSAARALLSKVVLDAYAEALRGATPGGL